MIDDAELVVRIRSGAGAEFAELVQRHQAMVFRILGRFERDVHQVEDLAQEAFVKAWQALDRFDGRAPFAHWMGRITTRVALDHLRRQRRRPEVSWEDRDPADAGGPAGEPVAAGAGDGDGAEAERARDLLETAMRELSAEEQLVLTLLELEERTVRETAALTGWSSVLVRVRAHRARKKLANVITTLRTRGHLP